MSDLNNFSVKELGQRFAELIELSALKETRIMLAGAIQEAGMLANGRGELLPPHISLVSGPGCPESAPTTQEIDKAIKLCGEKDVIVAAFRNFVRVPGSSSSLEMEKAKGADVRAVDCPLEALEIATDNSDKRVVFVGTGFEASAATVATAVLEARRQTVKNFLVLSLHRMLPPALDAALAAKDLQVDGILCYGHVPSVIGSNAFLSIPEKHEVPCVISGFSPMDILQSVYMLAKQLEAGRAKVENQFKSAVTFGGNRNALAVMDRVFRSTDVQWRGLGMIPKSGLILRLEFHAFRAESAFDLATPHVQRSPYCVCGNILAGTKNPFECPLFGGECTLEHPVGPSMASPDGPCSALHIHLTEETADSARSAA